MHKVLVLDNFDSFTYNLVDYLHQLNVETLVLRNNVELSDIEKVSFDSILISPGPSTPQDSGILMALIERYYLTKPIFGVCLGHQALGQFFGWDLSKALQPMHGKASMIDHTGHFLFEGIPSPFSAMRYHSLVCKGQSNESIEIIAQTAENEIMALAHKSLPIAALQFHPESILTPVGLSILKNWYASIN